MMRTLGWHAGRLIRPQITRFYQVPQARHARPDNTAPQTSQNNPLGVSQNFLIERLAPQNPDWMLQDAQVMPPLML